MATYTKDSELAAASALDGTEVVGVVQSGDSVKATVSEVSGGPQALTAKSADYTILDDNLNVYEVTTGAVDRTFELPTLAANAGRVIEIHKVDSGAGKVTVDGEGAETIDGAASVVLPSQYNYIRVRAGAAGWHILGIKANYDTGWVNQADLTDLTTTITHNLGVQIEQLRFYIVFATDSSGAGAQPPACASYDLLASANLYYGVHWQDNSRNANSIILQTGVHGVPFLVGGGGLVGEDGSTYDYYRVIITRKA